MISTLSVLSKRLPIKLVTSSLLILSMGMTPIALAQRGAPDDDAPRGNTTSTGTRGGCENSNQGELTVLAPTKEGKTVSVRPTFAWFVPNTKPLPMEFQLFELNGNNFKLITKINLTSSSGIRKVSLPEDKPDLTVGKRYHWQVIMLCNPNHPSTAITAQADFEVIEMPPALKSELSKVKELSQIVELYAKAGLWYDALREALSSAQDSSLGKIAANLLEQLAKIEDTQQSKKLREIASIHR
ncbi:DUF928 domain-containing protein [Aerosakkonemataceae cyanobacterium BLCC-F50]|uniref:DUF928 domain-containing protein n=1 Tax=Floridaenema flaviceps BLCC-F50 TaxID=3153642 RepID=A0ABV4XW17_9CYAN